MISFFNSFLLLRQAYTDTGAGSFQPWEYAGKYSLNERWTVSHLLSDEHHYSPSCSSHTVIGAAAFSSGVTRAVSTAVIVFELSGHSHLRLPISVALLVAFFVANRFTKVCMSTFLRVPWIIASRSPLRTGQNVYEEILDTNGTPSLPELPAELYMITAAEVSRVTPPYTLRRSAAFSRLFSQIRSLICNCWLASLCMFSTGNETD